MMTFKKTKAVGLKDIREGSLVMVRGNFGNGIARQAKVTYTDSNIKNGQPGIDYIDIGTKDSHWAYLTQVVEVLAY
jgi:hypothetical protein